jgi:predicted DNA-binding transcriptional regulator YafY
VAKKRKPSKKAKLRAAVAVRARKEIRSKWKVKPQNTNALVAAIQQASVEGRKLRIFYSPKYGARPSMHSVEPYEIKIKAGRGPYFYAWDTTKPTLGIHSFLLHRIVTADPINRGYEPRFPVKSKRKPRTIK